MGRPEPAGADAGWPGGRAGTSSIRCSPPSTNAVLFFVLARTVSRGELDAFANAFYVFTMVIGIERATRRPGARDAVQRRPGWRRGAQALGQAFGFILAVTVALGLILARDRTDPGRRARAGPGGAAAALPGLILQDAGRMAFFAQSRARDAAFNDALWAMLQFVGVALLVRPGWVRCTT